MSRWNYVETRFITSSIRRTSVTKLALNKSPLGDLGVKS